MKRRGVTSVFIHDDDTDEFGPYENVSELVRGATIKHMKELFGPLDGIRDEMKHESFHAVVAAVNSKNFIETFGNSNLFRRLADDASTIVEELMTGEVTLGLNSIKTLDNYLFQHSIDVALVSIMIARKLGFNDKRLKELIACRLTAI